MIFSPSIILKFNLKIRILLGQGGLRHFKQKIQGLFSSDVPPLLFRVTARARFKGKTKVKKCTLLDMLFALKNYNFIFTLRSVKKALLILPDLAFFCNFDALPRVEWHPLFGKNPARISILLVIFDKKNGVLVISCSKPVQICCTSSPEFWQDGTIFGRIISLY